MIPIPTKIFYGWVVVAAALLINVSTAPLSPVVFSFFIVPMSDELGWSLGAISLALTFRLGAGGLTAPLIGIIIDRFGPKLLGTFAGLVASASMIGLFYTQELWMLYVLFAVSGAVGLGGGPGGNLLTMVPVAKWFVMKRGRAMSIATTGVAIGVVIAIPVSQWVIHNVGWREAWIILGVSVGIVTAPLSFLFLRGAPSDLGLTPDGDQITDSQQSANNAETAQYVDVEINWTAKQVLKHPICWLMLLAFATSGFALAGTLVHRIAYWEAKGMSPSLIAFGTVMDPLTVVFAVLIFGFIGERVKIRYLGLFGGLTFALSMLPMIMSAGEAYTIFAHNIIWAIGAGAFVTTNNLIWPTYFGRKHLGTIRGIVFPLAVGASALGPPIYGFILDGGFDPTKLWLISTLCFATAGILLGLTRRPWLDVGDPKTT